MSDARNGSAGGSASAAWLRALELTAPIPTQPERILPVVIEEMAANGWGMRWLCFRIGRD